MKIAAFMVILIALPNALGQSPSCHGKPLDSESRVLQILETSTPEEATPDLRRCIIGAINYADELRSSAAVPQLIRYLSFEKEMTPAEKHGFFLRVPLEGAKYPAILALARIGAPATPALLQVIQSDSASPLEKENAAHAIVLSYLSGPEHDPGKGILYLRKAKMQADPKGKENLDSAINYVLTTRACTRFASKCSDAMKQSISSTQK